MGENKKNIYPANTQTVKASVVIKMKEKQFNNSFIYEKAASYIPIKLYGGVGVPKGDYDKFVTVCKKNMREPAYTSGEIGKVFLDVKTMINKTPFPTWIRSNKYFRKYIRIIEEYFDELFITNRASL